VKRDLTLDRARRDKMRARKTGREIVERHFVGAIHHGDLGARENGSPLPDLLRARRGIQHIPRRYAGWVSIRRCSLRPKHCEPAALKKVEPQLRNRSPPLDNQ
jgi:hypothetical protein